MKCIIVIAIMFMSFTSFAGQNEYDQCVLKYLKGTKNDVVTQMIQQACQENYMSPDFTSDRKKAYNNCLLENLPGTESVSAAMEIRNACDRISKN